MTDVPIDLDEYLKKELAADLSSDRPKVRKDAVTVLGRLGTGTRTLEILKTVADSDPDEGTRGQARSVYGDLWARVQEADGVKRSVADEADPSRLDLGAFAKALEDESPVRRLRALLEGINMFDERMAPLVLARLEVEQDDWVLATMVKAIAVGGDVAHIERIAPFLKDDRRARLVANTIEAIACIDPQAARGMLRPFINHGDSRVQSTAVIALYRVEASEAMEALRGMARSPLARSREAAVHCLTQIDDRDARDILLAMLNGENNYQLVERVVTFLIAKGDVAVAAKALALTQAPNGVAGVFAYKRVVRGISERLKVPEHQLKSDVPAAEIELFVRLALHRGAGRTGTVPVRSPSRPERTTVAAAPPRKSHAQAFAVGALVLVCGAGAWVALGPGTSERGVPAVTASVSPQSLSTTPSPAAFANAVVSWELTVKDLDPTGRQMHLFTGTTRVAAVFDRPCDVRPGDRVRVRGRVMGRSRFGPVHLEGLAVERL